MFILLDADRRLDVCEPHDFRRFKVVIDGVEDLDAARRALSSLAELVDIETAWVSEESLRRWPTVAADPQWQNALGGMIEKARSYGWIDDASRRIKAHVEWRAREH